MIKITLFSCLNQLDYRPPLYYRPPIGPYFKLLLVLVLLSVSPLALANAQGALPSITLLLLDDQPELEPSGPVTATLQSLTRVHGVSPETVYFSAHQSNDIADESLQHRYGRLAYHFHFDDPDSGAYATTGGSKNHQVSGSPRAIHTFICTPESSRYQSGVCTYQVGVRVQNPAGEYADDFLTVTISGSDHYYSAADTLCISTTGDFTGCEGTQLNQTPDVGEFSGKRVRFRRGESFASACIGYQESTVLLDAFGEGEQRPFLPSVRVGVDSSCNDGVPSNADLVNYPDLSRDVNGHISQGWAYDVTVTGLRLGSAGGGMASTLVTWHDLDLDWSSDPSYDGEFELGNFGRACTQNADLDCANIPYPYGVFVTDTVARSHPSNLAGVNMNCYIECGLINSGAAGVDLKTASGHNFRIQGAWGLVVSNVWFRGEHIGENGPKSRITLRLLETSVQSSLIADPEDFGSGAQLRNMVATARWSNRYNMVLDSRFNEASQAPEHDSASFVEFRSGHQYSGIYGNQFFDDPVSDGAQIRLGGTNIFARDNLYNGVDSDCRYDDTFANGTAYQNDALIFADSNTNCNSNVPAIATPNQPGS
ncbi:hypothetical protein GCM10008090_29550 [Arenicella chitinivorans]|uniref:Uncharacterized protein n=1 Tax=Arenicella chitinivorans TaxID=1329800 RepID=A0A918VS56_9GAMM|nr:DUF5011 domain-containing protein [Arenicella chitinivorans]GHA17915.1 hypothetical protein GCM10008090_29550 [Arenicella chitinivorans]